MCQSVSRDILIDTVTQRVVCTEPNASAASHILTRDAAIHTRPAWPASSGNRPFFEGRHWLSITTRCWEIITYHKAIVFRTWKYRSSDEIINNRMAVWSVGHVYGIPLMWNIRMKLPIDVLPSAAVKSKSKVPWNSMELFPYSRVQWNSMELIIFPPKVPWNSMEFHGTW